MNPIEFNQYVVNHIMENIHGKCMDTCLDRDPATGGFSAEYEMWAAQRERMQIVCEQTAMAARDYHEYINRFNTHRMPSRVRLTRILAAKGAARKYAESKSHD